MRIRGIVFAMIVLVLLLSASAPAFADFVCPVFKSAAVGMHNPNAVPIGLGHYTIIPGKSDHLNVPDHATNMDGAGSPPGPHAMPGDPDYSAIWNAP